MAAGDVYSLGAALVLGLSTVIVTAWLLKKRMDRNKFRLVGHVSHLVIYPVKSCRGLEVNSAECTRLGLSNGLAKDRTFVICDREGEVLTARARPNQVLIAPSFNDDAFLRLEAPGFEPIDVPIADDGPTRKCKVWDDWTEGRDCGDEVSAWLDRYFGCNEPRFRLLQFDPARFEPRSLSLFKDKTKRETGLKLDPAGEWDAFAAPYSDLAPFHLLSEESVADLNSKLTQGNRVSYRNFRPNMVVRGLSGAANPFAEDQWHQIRIGDEAQFVNFKPCDRCTLPNVDVETGERNKNMEPLKTLKKYRLATDPTLKKLLGGPMMGVNLGLVMRSSHDDAATLIRVGDPVYATLK